MEDFQALLTESQAAKRLGARPTTLNKWRTRNKGPAYLKLAGKVRYRAADIEAFIEGSRVIPAERNGKHGVRRTKGTRRGSR